MTWMNELCFHKMNDSTVFIIGASGAIGRKLVAHLCSNNVKVIAAIRKTKLPKTFSKYIENGNLIQEFNVDVRNRSTISQALQNHSKIDAVWMLAAPLSIESDRNPKGAEDIVIGGLKRLLSVMSERKIKRICFSDSIGSYGSEAPRNDCTAKWLIEHPMQDPGSVYGKQKRTCRELMKQWVDEDLTKQRSSRFAIIPGVLHDDESWGDGTTEYVLEAIKCAAYHQTYNCIIHPNEPLPMILRKDLVRGLSLLTFAKPEDLTEPEGGYTMSGLSFTPLELFAAIETIVPDFTWTYDDTISSPAKEFAKLWPNTLSSKEAARDLKFHADSTSLTQIVSQLLKAWKNRQGASKL